MFDMVPAPGASSTIPVSTHEPAGPYAAGMRSTPMGEERAALIALLRTRPDGLTWSDITLRVLSRGSAVEVWEECAPLTLMPADEDPVSAAQDDLRAWHREGLRVTTVLDEDYPHRLAGIHQTPPLLFALGELRADDRAVSVVGSRKASPQGQQIAAGVASDLVHEGFTVLSGLAAGIDTAAHTAALAAGGRTVAVIGTGIRRAYPAANRSLQDEIGRRGLVLSQFWPDAPPRSQHFPMRNATMSGYGLATVVIEAGEHSGARIQARLAVEHGRPVILTQMVVDRNSWGKELVGRPRVHVASSRADVVHLVRDLEQEDQELEGLVRQFADA
jgi:DNA processing protein